jgi:hypothetical protein
MPDVWSLEKRLKSHAALPLIEERAMRMAVNASSEIARRTVESVMPNLASAACATGESNRDRPSVIASGTN